MPELLLVVAEFLTEEEERLVVDPEFLKEEEPLLRPPV